MTGRLHPQRNAAIIAAYKSGVSQKELAAQYHLTRQAVSLVVLQKPLLSAKHARPPVVSMELAATIRDEYAVGCISLAKLVRRHNLTMHHVQKALGTRVPGRGKRRQMFLAAD